jgi:hypothetical protein
MAIAQVRKRATDSDSDAFQNTIHWQNYIASPFVDVL